MATKFMWTGVAILALGALIVGAGLYFLIGGLTWPQVAIWEGRTFATVNQVQEEGAVLVTLGTYTLIGGVATTVVGALLGGLGFLRRRSETV